MKNTINETVKIPDGVNIETKNDEIIVTGPKGSVQKSMRSPMIKILLSQTQVEFRSDNATKREKKMLFTFRAHLKNMMRGVTNSHVYKLKICSGHFPMNVTYNNSTLTIKNFLGESVPRVLKLKTGVDLELDGQIITLESPDIEKAGQAAADIEQLTRITNRDRRIFQDGIFIIKKSKKLQNG